MARFEAKRDSSSDELRRNGALPWPCPQSIPLRPSQHGKRAPVSLYSTWANKHGVQAASTTSASTANEPMAKAAALATAAGPQGGKMEEVQGGKGGHYKYVTPPCLRQRPQLAARIAAATASPHLAE